MAYQDTGINEAGAVAIAYSVKRAAAAKKKGK